MSDATAQLITFVVIGVSSAVFGFGAGFGVGFALFGGGL